MTELIVMKKNIASIQSGLSDLMAEVREMKEKSMRDGQAISQLTMENQTLKTKVTILEVANKTGSSTA